MARGAINLDSMSFKMFSMGWGEVKKEEIVNFIDDFNWNCQWFQNYNHLVGVVLTGVNEINKQISYCSCLITVYYINLINTD